VSRPDFVIIGAMKCGTTTLADQLAAQDGIFITDPKEPNFFSDEDNYGRGEAWYASLFDAAGEGDLLGEASTHYTKQPLHPHAPDRLHRYAPDAKLIYMVRDPVARALSQLRHHWTMREVEGDDFEALARSHDPLWQYSSYAMQLTPWAERYGRERILLLSLERLEVDPEGEFGRVLRFLGTDGAWKEDLGAGNVGAERSRRLPLHDLIVDNPAAASLRRAVVPKSVRNWIRKRRQLESFSVSAASKSYLADRVRGDITAFGELVGEDGLTPENFAERMRARALSFV
jgi:hypothetical protein